MWKKCLETGKNWHTKKHFVCRKHAVSLRFFFEIEIIGVYKNTLTMSYRRLTYNIKRKWWEKVKFLKICSAVVESVWLVMWQMRESPSLTVLCCVDFGARVATPQFARLPRQGRVASCAWARWRGSSPLRPHRPSAWQREDGSWIFQSIN